MRRLIRALVIAALVGLPEAGLADHPTQGMETLTGVPGVAIEVAPLDSRLSRNGVTRQAVRRAVSRALDAAGIATDGGQHTARLHVRLDTRHATPRFLALSIELDLRQHVRLERAPERVISATTWSNAAVTPLREGDHGAVAGRVADLVRQTFIRDFRAANPQ